MNKTLLIIRREYLSRVRKKTFILSTILTPLLFVVLMGVVIFITVKKTRKENIAVVDSKGILKATLPATKNITYDFRSGIDTGNYATKGYTGILYAPHEGINNSDGFQLISTRTMSGITQNRIEKDVQQSIENNLISTELQIDPALIDSIKKRARAVGIQHVKLAEIGKESSNQFVVASALGYVSAFLIYIMLFVYGVMVMRGVMEEKTSRIAEVIVSSVKPFQLMLGKIVGIGAVGLTQFLIWIVLLGILSTLMGVFIPQDVLIQAQQGSPMTGSSQQTSEAVRVLASTHVKMAQVQVGTLVACFIFYFLGGYLFYAALFAAVGSAINEDASDAQSLSLPITIPIVIAIVIMVNSISDPNSTLATWSSIIPFFSPIVMMSRIPFGVPGTVPYWQLGLSMALLVLGFLATTWISARIYRTGILMYGKKPGFKDIKRWIKG